MNFKLLRSLRGAGQTAKDPLLGTRHVITLLAVLIAPNIGAADDRICDQVRKRIERNRPEKVVVVSVVKPETAIVVQGNASNPNAIAMFVENIKNDPTFTVPEVKFVRMTTEGPPPLYDYEFSFSLRHPDAACVESQAQHGAADRASSRQACRRLADPVRRRLTHVESTPLPVGLELSKTKQRKERAFNMR